jgi:PhnB protein
MKNKVMHVSIPISSETMLMGSDTFGSFGPPFVEGNNFSISLTTDSREKADDFFNKLSDGGRVTMPMSETFWGDYFGMLTDKFNINWMVAFPLKQD